MTLANALFQWEEGDHRLRRLRDQDSPRYRSADRAVSAVQDGLRRRIGPTFAAAELAELYGAGTDWCLEAARAVLPDQAASLDPQVFVDAAFWLYLRKATDFAGGKLSAE